MTSGKSNGQEERSSVGSAYDRRIIAYSIITTISFHCLSLHLCPLICFLIFLRCFLLSLHVPPNRFRACLITEIRNFDDMDSSET
nr:hypothetical protein CFP56_51796 [Quercus suber]